MAYADRKHTLSKKQLAAMSKWAAQKPDAVAEKAKITEKQRDLWDALNQYVTERGAMIVSVKHANPVRLEVPLDSELPAKLRELGYDPIYCEQATRIGAPVSTKRGRWTNLNNGYSFRTVDVFELRLK
jgi:hypothetical protein